MFSLIYMLVLMVNEWSICICDGTKKFTSIDNVLPLIETQPWYIQILTVYHLFLRNSIGNTIMQCTEHIILDMYCKAQKSLPQNSKYWWVQVWKSPWDTTWMLVGVNLKNTSHSIFSLKHFPVPALTNIWNFEVNSFEPYNTHLMWCVLCIAWWYCLWNPWEMGDIWLKSVYTTVVSLSEAIHCRLM